MSADVAKDVKPVSDWMSDLNLLNKMSADVAKDVKPVSDWMSDLNLLNKSSTRLHSKR